MRNVVIGGSAAGVSAAEAMRAVSNDCEITIISDEKDLLYSRPLISYYLAGKLEEADLLYRPRDFFKQNKIEVLAGERATEVDLENKTAVLQGGKKIAYDNLLIATGASPSFPNIAGTGKRGVLGLRTLQDTRAILQMLPQVKQAVVLGGGLVGLKAATGLMERGVDVIVSVSSPHVLSQMMDGEAAAIFEQLLEENGIHISTGTRAAEILGNERVSGVGMESGEELPCQLVIVGKGVAANMDLVRDTEIKHEYGILIDDHCRTNIKGIYAAGDVAQSMDIVRKEGWTNALWPCATEQGRIAGLNMAGQDAVYDGSMGMNSIQFLELPVIAAGLAGLRERDYDEELIRRPAERVYKRLVLKDNRVIGFVLVGDIENAGIIRSLMAKQVDVSDIKDDILEPTFNLSTIGPIMRENEERFAEREYQEFQIF